MINSDELKKIINDIDKTNTLIPDDVNQLTYSELLYLHFILESHASYGKVMLKETDFPHEFDQTIFDELIRKNFLLHINIDTLNLNSFISKNSKSFNRVQKEYFDLLRNHFSSSTVLINENDIKYSDLKNMVFCKLQKFTSLKYEDIKGESPRLN